MDRTGEIPPPPTCLPPSSPSLWPAARSRCPTCPPHIPHLRARGSRRRPPPLPASPDMLWRMRACRSSNWHGDPRRGQSSRWASGPVARDMPWSISDQPSTTLRTDYGDECDFATDLRTPSIFSELFLLMRNVYD
jgi:hypothetical protein